MKRIAYVDGLRAVAVLSVASYHAFAPGHQGSAGAPIGVSLFFVISGFCLAYPTLSRLSLDGAAQFDVLGYAARRVVRIVPPYYIAIAALVIFAAILTRLGIPLPRSMPPAGITPVEVVQAIFFLDGHTHYIDWSFWTLPVEFRWYFLFPVALWLWTRSPRSFGVVVLALAFVVPLTLASSIDLFVLPAFLLGIVAAHLRVNGHRYERLALPLAIILTASAYITSPTFITPLWAAAMFCIVVAAGSFKWIEAALSWRWLAYVGLASYSIYLVHQPIILFAEGRGCGPVLALAIGIAVGFGFWAIAERLFVGNALRNAMIGKLLLLWYTGCSGMGAHLRLRQVGASAGIERRVMVSDLRAR
ncbi:MAG TPA: acyltransferase [Candidatus Cybelea sp.]